VISSEQKTQILERATAWFEQTIVKNHIQNTQKLTNPDEFNINPFLVSYLAQFAYGQVTLETLARALVIPRIMGTSINTSFGQNMQQFMTDVLGPVFGSMISGLDIEFTDAIDGRKKFCQVKLGPNTINKDDVLTIHQHFDAAKKIATQNRLGVALKDFVVGIGYGTLPEVSSFYKRLRDEHHYTLYVGQEFWQRLTGDSDFYADLIKAMTMAANNAASQEIIEDTIQQLSRAQVLQDVLNGKF
jgi:hypothetical protein